MDGRTTLTDILHKYSHVFPAPGDSVTGRTQWSVTKSRLTVLGPSAVGHVALPGRASGRTGVVKDMLEGDKSNRVTVPGRHLLC